MKKFALSILGLTAIMSITGCGSTSSNTSGASRYTAEAQSILPNVRAISLKKGDSYDVSVAIRPYAAYSTKLTFESSDSSIASVNNKGKVSAKAPGHATVTITASNYVDDVKTPDLRTTVEIYVYKMGSTADKKSLLTQMKAYQEEHCELPDNIILYDYRVYDLVQNGKSQDRTDERQIYANSRSRGLMHYNSVEWDVNVTDGGQSVQEYGYICQTKESYGSYMYHYSDNVKNVFYIATEFNKGKVSRFDTMKSILDCYFSVSNDYFTGSYEDIFSTDWFDDFNSYARLVSKFGSYRNNDEFCISYTLSQSYSGEFDEEDECRWATQLPCGIKYKAKESMTYTWVNGYLRNMMYSSGKTFEMDGLPYEYNVTLNQSFVIVNDFEIVSYIPDDSQFNNVEYWYDI